MQSSNYQLIKIYIPLIITFLFTILQYVVLAIFGYTPYPDSNGYIIVAKECIELNDWYPATITINNDSLPFIWNIGAINAVIASLRFFGSITPLLFLYSTIKGMSAWLIYSIASKVFDSKTALFTLIIYILYPANYGEGTSLLSETPFIFFILLGIYVAICHNKYIVGGAFIAIANWVRPMGLVFLLALIIYRYKKTIRIFFGYILMIVIIGSCCYFRTGYFIYQAKTGWMALLQYSVDNTVDKQDNTLIFIGKANAVEKDKIWRKNFMTWIKLHPKDYFFQMPKKFIKTYISDNVNLCVFIKDKEKKTYMYEELDMRHIIHCFPHYNGAQLLTAINLIYYYFLMCAFIVGTVLMVRKKEYKQLILPLSVVVIGTLVLLLFGHGESRFHIPFMPFIIMIVAYNINTKLYGK